MARYTYAYDRAESARLQISAHARNPYVLKPKHGMQSRKITLISDKRINGIREWLRSHGTAENAFSVMEELLGRLEFGVRAEQFESALHELGIALGFACQRPEKELGEGPDNLWAVSDDMYIIFECKSEVKKGRLEIYESESGQMNNSCAWFKREYSQCKFFAIMIIPASAMARGGGFNENVEIMREGHLTKLVKSVRSLFTAIRSFDVKALTDAKLQELINENGLSSIAFTEKYSSPVHYTRES